MFRVIQSNVYNTQLCCSSCSISEMFDHTASSKRETTVAAHTTINNEMISLYHVG